MPGPGQPPSQMSLFDEGSSGSPRGSAAGPQGIPRDVAAPATPLALPASTQARHAVQLGEHRVAYELRRARRRSIGFTVSVDGLVVNAPRWVGLGDIDAALREKAAWILRKLHEQHERAQRQWQARVEWREGGSVPFLGDPVFLVLDERTAGAVLHCAQDALPGVPHLTLHLGLPQHAGPAQIRDMVQSWLQRQARRIFEERCALYAQRLGVRVQRLALSSAATRWGSASADGAIRLNWRLVHFGLPVIDYVVTHELAHLREMNHSPAFWSVVRSVMPGYEQARSTLRHSVLPLLDVPEASPAPT